MQKWVRCPWEEALLATSMAFQLLSAPHFSKHFTQLSGHFSQCKGSYDMPVWKLSTTCQRTQENSSALTCMTCKFLKDWLSFISLQLFPIWACSSFCLECSAPTFHLPVFLLVLQCSDETSLCQRNNSLMHSICSCTPQPPLTHPHQNAWRHTLLLCIACATTCNSVLAFTSSMSATPPMRLSSMSDAKIIQTFFKPVGGKTFSTEMESPGRSNGFGAGPCSFSTGDAWPTLYQESDFMTLGLTIKSHRLFNSSWARQDGSWTEDE